MTTTTDTDAPKGQAKGQTRSNARLGAVQALYQHTQNPETAIKALVDEYINTRLGKVLEGDEYAPADIKFFGDLVRGTHGRQSEIDEKIKSFLKTGWSLERLEKIVLAILRVGTYELIARPDVPTKVIINEYMDVAKAFFDGAEPKFVNALLDNLSKDIRG
jgi:N utilization substance protein B